MATSDTPSLKEILELRNFYNVPIPDIPPTTPKDPPQYVLISEDEYLEWKVLAKRAAELLSRVATLELKVGKIEKDLRENQQPRKRHLSGHSSSPVLTVNDTELETFPKRLKTGN